MADLDVAVKLRFLALGEEKIRTAARDLTAFGRASHSLSTAAGGRLTGDLTKAWTASVKLGGALDKTSGSASRAAFGLGRIGSEARGVERTRVAIEGVGKAAAATEAKVSAMARAMSQSTMAGARLKEGMSSAGKAARAPAAGAATSETTVGAAEVAAAGGFMKGGLPMAAGAYAIVRAVKEAMGSAIEFETAMTDVKRKVELPAGKSWKETEKDISEVARAIGMTRVEIAQIMAQGGQGNVPYEQLRGFAELSAKVASGWEIPAKEAAQMLTEVRGATGWANAELQTFAEKVDYLGNISSAAEKDIGKMWQRAAEGAKAAGVSYDDAMVSLTALRSVGMQDEVASRFFGAFSAKLRNAKALPKEGKKALAQLGLTPDEVAAGMDKNAMGTMIDILERLAKAENKVAIANALGGGEWFDEILRMVGALPELKRLRDALADASKWKGSLDRSLAQSLDTTAKKFERIKVIVEEVGASLMKWSLEPLKRGMDSIIQGYDKAKKTTAETGFLAKPGGEAPDRMKPKAPVPFSPENRKRFLGGGATPPANAAAVNGSLFDAIIRAEGTAKYGDPYNTSLGYMKSPKPLTQMTMDEALAWGDKVRAAQGMNSSAKGAFQIVNTTQRAAMAALGIRGDEMFSPENQRRMAAWIAKKQGIGAWEGFKFHPAERAAARAALEQGATTLRPTISGTPRASSGGSTGAAKPAPSTPGKQARALGGVVIQQAHFHGVRDIAHLERQIAARADRHIRRARDGALHDIA